MVVLVEPETPRAKAEGRTVSAVHKFGFGDPREFVVGLLDCGWEPGTEFTEVLCTHLPDLDPDDLEDWVTEWERDRETD